MDGQKERTRSMTRRGFIKVTGAIVFVAGTGGCSFSTTKESPTPTNQPPVVAPTKMPAPTATPEAAQILVPADGIPAADGYLLVDIEKCQGCSSCMLACSLIHEGVESLSLARIQILQNSAS